MIVTVSCTLIFNDPSPRGIVLDGNISFGTIHDTAAVSVFEEISVPHTMMDKEQLKEGIPAFKLYHMVGLASSGSAARRLIEQGGAYVNGKRIESYDYLLTDRDIVDLEILLRAGKKRYHKIKLI